MRKRSVYRPAYSTSEHQTTYADIAIALDKVSADFPLHHIPSREDPDWLPVDEVLIKIASRRRNPRLRSSDEKSHEAGALRAFGAHKIVRAHLAVTFHYVSAADPELRQYDIDDCAIFIESATELKTVLLDFLDTQTSGLYDLPTFSSGEIAEERARRYGIACDLTAYLNAAAERLNEMESWAWDKYDALSPPKGGKPSVKWKHEFVRCLAHTWFMLTGDRAPAGPRTLFVEFVELAWASGGDELPEVPWEATIRSVCAPVRGDKT